MENHMVNPPELYEPVGYSHVIAATGGTTVYIAGQVSNDAAGVMIGEGDVGVQSQPHTPICVKRSPQLEQARLMWHARTRISSTMTLRCCPPYERHVKTSRATASRQRAHCWRWPAWHHRRSSSRSTP
jgi:hypothetical protein